MDFTHTRLSFWFWNIFYVCWHSNSWISFADTKEGRYNPRMDPVIPVQNWRKGSQVDFTFWWLSWFLYLQEILTTTWKAHNLLSLELTTYYLFIAFCFLFFSGSFWPGSMQKLWWMMIQSSPYFNGIARQVIFYLAWFFCLLLAFLLSLKLLRRCGVFL